MERYPDAANEIKSWTAIMAAVRWHNVQDVRGMFKDADIVDGHLVFNFRHNRYRLITIVHYAKTKASSARPTEGHVYIRSFLTHKEYESRSNWDRMYGTIMSTILADPAEMIAHGAPRVIHNDVELEMYTDALFRLAALDNPTRTEAERSSF
jgi:mRNA-degrading endonuclease HigB of HigAB toxin-antitoxin module